MNVELHGPVWAWILVGLWVFVIGPFIGGFVKAVFDEWRKDRQQQSRARRQRAA